MLAELTTLNFKELRLFGRQPELQALRDAFDRAATVTPSPSPSESTGGGGPRQQQQQQKQQKKGACCAQLVVVEGESGTGKSALFRTFLKQVSQESANKPQTGGGGGGDCCCGVGKFEENDSELFAAITECLEQVNRHLESSFAEAGEQEQGDDAMDPAQDQQQPKNQPPSSKKSWKDHLLTSLSPAEIRILSTSLVPDF